MSEVLLGQRGRWVLSGFGLLAVVFVAAPILVLVPIAFSGDNNLLLPPRSFSLEWFGNLVSQPRWRNAALLSLVVALISALASTILGTLAAIGIHRLDPRLGRVLKLLFVAPMIVPLMVIAVGFYVYFVQFRIAGQFVALPLSHTILGLPLVVLPVLARLSHVDGTLERASASLGAGQGRTLWQVVLPQLRPAMAAGFALAFITSFDEVIVAQFLSGPRLETLPRRLWEGLAVGGLDNTITAIAVVQLALAVAALAGFELYRRFRSMSVLAAASVAPPGPVAGPAIVTGQATAGTVHGHGIPIRFERITKIYRDTPVVDAVDFTVEAGEFLTILGPSGSGKTTLLMLVAGFVSLDSGRLLFGEADLSAVPPNRREIGVVFQNYALFPHMTVLDNVAFPLAARGLSKAECRRRAHEALALVRLEGFADRHVSQLSGGQQQRVAFARAVVFGPRALLMDEPLAALDKSLRHDMQDEIRSLQRRVGHTTIYVTHDQEEALNLSDRIAVMNHGRLQQIGTPQQLYLTPANPFVAGFFGEANLLAGMIDGEAFAASGLPALLPAKGLHDGPAVACLRPDRLRIVPSGGRIAGTLVEARFNGPVTRLTVETPIGPLRVTQSAVVPLPPAGATVALDFDPEALHLMSV